MSAPHIPNLLNNYRTRGGAITPIQRGRGRGGHSSAAPLPARNDAIIQATDIDAATSRLSAVSAGYLEDPFAALLTPSSASQPERRLPLMNRGTYVRTTAIDRVVETFLAAAHAGEDGDGKEGKRKQIISLGAGSDTRFFRFRRKIRQKGEEIEGLRYHEVDFAENTKKKIERVTGSAFVELARKECGLDLSSGEVAVSDNGSRLSSANYSVHALDLRDLHTSPSTTETDDNLKTLLPGVDVTNPTLLISECCLVYLAPKEADALLEYFSALFTSAPLCVAIYEPIRPDDAFGRTMVSNLTSRGIHLQTLEKYASLSKQRERLKNSGFSGGAEAADIDFIWRRWVQQEERERVEGLEWMDEVEEFTLFARHYCVAWGWRGFGEDARWRELPGQGDDG